MSCNCTNTSYNNNNKTNNRNNKVPSDTMNSVKNINPIIWKLIDLTTGKEHTRDGTCTMAVVLQQQGIYNLYDIQSFDLKHDFEDDFTYYKEHDKDVSTNNEKISS